jgi:hypothetical protein
MKEKHRHSVEVNGDAVIIQRVFSAKDGDPGSGMAVGSNWKQLYKKEDIINGEVYQEFRYLKTNE